MAILQSLNKPLIIFFESFIFLFLIGFMLMPFIIVSLNASDATIAAFQPITPILLGVISFCILLAIVIQMIFRQGIRTIAKKLTDEMLSW